MKRFKTYLFAITCAAVLVSACNPLDVDTPRDVRIENPDPDLRPARTVSIMFAVDASTSMGADSDWLDTRNAIAASLDFLNGRYDLAGLVAYNNTVSVAAPLSSDIYKVTQAMDGIRPSGETLMWDGAYEAVQALLQGEPRDVRSVILVTDGRDDGSFITLDSLKQFANTNRISIYTVGLGTAIDPEQLEALAVFTEGQYYYYDKEPDTEPLNVIFSDIIIDKMRQTP